MAHPSIADLRDAYQLSRQAAIRAYARQKRADVLVSRLARLADHTLQALVNTLSLPDNAALLAVGGYGRRELYPGSDVDIMILLAESPDDAAVKKIEPFIAALWDLGLDPSHSVRTVAQCRQLATTDVTIQTALLEARHLTGDLTLTQKLSEVLSNDMDPRIFFLAKRAEMRRRHAHFYDTPYALEPNCKESPGALRDLQLLRWLAHGAGYGASWRALMQSGLLSQAEYRGVRRAEAAFRRLRVELHLLTGRREDRILFDLQPALAKIYGFQSDGQRLASEQLMQRYYWAARVVTQLSMLLTAQIEERLFPLPATTRPLDDHFRIHGGRLDVTAIDAMARNPTLILRSFIHLQQQSGVRAMTARTLRALWHSRTLIDAQFRENPVNKRLFLRILKQPSGVASALYAMTRLNVLPRYLPEFRRIVGQMQHDLFHRYTVDEHILKVIDHLERCGLPEYAHEYPLASELMAGLDQPWRLYVAALFHDIAKGSGADHSEQGAIYAQRFCRQHRLATDDSAVIVFLVRHHLLMSYTAQKSDLSDPQVISRFAHTVGDAHRLTALYLLTIADIRATSPSVWNSWKGRLLDDLYRRSLAFLGGAASDAHTVLSLRQQNAIQQLEQAGISAHERQAIWQSLDVAYFLRHQADDIVWHTEQLVRHGGGLEPVVQARMLEPSEALQVMVYVPDRDGLFAAIAHYFDTHNWNVQEARIHTTRHGWALDSFIVLHPAHNEDYRRAVPSLCSGLLQHLSDAHVPPPLRTVYECGVKRRQARAFPFPAQIDLRPDERGAFWRLQLVCRDRPGLLYALARVFAEQEINLTMAKIDTLGDRAEDTFILDGDTLAHTAKRLALEAALMDALVQVQAHE